MARRMSALFLVFICVALMLAACGKEGESGSGAPEAKAKDEKPSEPVTIRMYQFTGNITDEEFQHLMAEPVKEKYPYITMEIVRAQKGASLEDALSAGDFPDLIFPGSDIRDLIRLKAVQDLSGLIKKQNFDIGRFEPQGIEGIKNQSDDGTLYALPFSVNFSALFYNKDIFDKFGVSYPKEGMTWDEAIALGKKVARTEGGVTYEPLNPGGFNFFIQPIQKALVDPGTNKATLTTNALANALKLYKEAADLPGNGKPGSFDPFIKDQTSAMVAARGAIVGQLDDLYKKGDPLKWDMTAIPSFKEYSGIGQMNSPFLMSVYSQGKHQEDAFRALSVIVSDENQLKVTKSGRLSALKDKKFQENFGADLASLKGKNVKAAFNYKPAVSPRTSVYENLAAKSLNNAVDKVLTGDMDVNTALKAAEEEANQSIAAEMK